MRRLIKLAIMALATRVFLRWWKGRKESSARSAQATPAEDPADELRRKLAVSREDEPAVEATPTEAVADRRNDVHEQGRAALDEMNAKTED